MKRNNGCLGKGMKYTICGETMTISEFARKYNLNESVIRGRIKNGVPDDRIFLSVKEYRRTRNKGWKNKEQYNKNCCWTQSALDCYEIGADCKKCLLPADIKKECQMAKRIIKIVRLFGKPYDRDNNIIEE